MSSIHYSQGDPISKLPVDQSQPTSNELQIVNSLFTKHKSTMNILIEESKDSVIIGLLFVVFSLPVVDDFVKRVVPMAEKSPYILVAIKAVAVMALYWLIKHFYLARKDM